ncbi:MAG: aminotransferase class III-fold pyridoxal phosphate-dependent enzyme, partial [Chloroflexi bacterium]|nr:aminotransferase class III-fold pyridoxal phosphate-dependent enzyme [Chloroflexota bacterium]
FKRIREICDRHGVLLILDEVMCGMGRSGTLHASEQEGVAPDIMTVAKGLGGGVPVGGFLATERVSVLEPGDHGSTYGGNPLVCATALAVMRYVLDHDIPTHAARVGAHFQRRLQELRKRWPAATGVRGRGLLLALQFDREISGELLLAAVDEGLLINAVTPSAIRFMPALTITEAEIDEAVARLERAIERVLAQARPVPAV